MGRKLSVLFTASEADPFIKVGGLGDVAGSLPGAILSLNPKDRADTAIDIRLVIPYHSMINVSGSEIKHICQFPVQFQEVDQPIDVYLTELNNLPVYLLSSEWIHSSDRVYDQDVIRAAKKYMLFSKAVAMLPEVLGWQVDILHANDWHTALSIPITYALGKKNVRTVFSIHNLPFMGSETRGMLSDFHIAPSTHPQLPDWARELPLPMASDAADKVVAVSPTYAREIMTPEFGCDLDPFFFSIQDKLTGILNGINYSTWNPSADKSISQNFDIDHIEKRMQNKRFLQDKFNLPRKDDAALFIVISRFDKQKGIDLIIQSLKQLEGGLWQAILLGSGDIVLERMSQELAMTMLDQVHSENCYNANLSHQLYAGGDMILMPSRYEPCGLAQMIAMRYGCIPLARATGGLKDSIMSFEQDPDHATGFLFDQASADALTTTIQQALNIYAQKNKWENIQKNAMKMDFSWDSSARKYIQLYRKLEARQ
ncbi:MAG: glycogen synthase [Anaerolineaceae bacterium]